MSKIKNSGLDQYGTEPFKQQQFGTAGIEGVKSGICCHIPSNHMLIHEWTEPLFPGCDWLQNGAYFSTKRLAVIWY